MKKIGIKLADGSFYPILDEGEAKKRILELTTAKDNQTTVQIDLYRSETNSVEDAEYVDTLVVKHLKPHPNGEPELHLSVGIDENNELTAEVVDSETGKKSEFSCQLVSKTLSEGEIFDHNDNSTDISDVNVSDEPFNFDAAETIDESILDGDTDFASEPADSENRIFSEPDVIDDTVFDIPDETVSDNIISETDSGSSEPALEDFAMDIPATDPSFDSEIEEPAKTDSNSPIEPETIDDFNFDNIDTDFNLDDAETSEDKLSELDSSIFNPENDIQEPLEGSIDLSEAAKEASDFSEETFSDDEIDFGLDDETVSDSDADNSEIKESDFEVPDFDSLPLDTIGSDNSDATVSEESDNSFELPDDLDFNSNTVSEPETEGLGDFFDDLNKEGFDSLDTDSDFNADLDFETDDIPSKKDPSHYDKAISGNSMDFSNLYDEKSLESPEDAVKRKTRVPVAICVVCAIICLFATALILFVVPSKYNLLKSRNTKVQKTETVKIEKSVDELNAEKEMAAKKAEEERLAAEQARLEEERRAEEARLEAERIAAEEKARLEAERKAAEEAARIEAERKAAEEAAKKIVPVPPKKNPKAKDVSYKIKWGDTLWDISEAYYKNPWKYKKIARFNNIKNPDHIISGNTITIPAE